jgi:uncharacterized protein YkwD
MIKIQIRKIVLLFILGSSVTAVAQSLNTQSDALSAHNAVRRLHHAPPLVWDNTLAVYAEKYAERCRFQHSSSPYGENLATGYPSIKAAIDTWYGEAKHYSYDRPEFSSQTGHFTQVVWKDTQRVGCGYVACDGRNGTPGKFLVCEYSPRGNVMSRELFEKNVLPV